MSSKLRQIISSLLMACVLGMLLPGYVMTSQAAGSARISFSDPTVTVGEEVSVTMKFESTDGAVLGNTKTTLAYDASLLEYVSSDGSVDGGAGTLVVRSEPAGQTAWSITLRFKALQAGAAKLSITEANAYNNDAEWLDNVQEGSSAITISPLATSSTDATLQSLQISPGNLNPAFTPQTDAYHVTVGLDTDKLTVSAKPNNDGATVELNGTTDLQEGENTLVYKVTAEDGVTTKDYTITVNRIAGGEAAAAGEEDPAGTETTLEPLFTITVLTKKFEVLPLGDGITTPKNFEPKNFKINETTVSGWVFTSEESDYIVLYGRLEGGEAGFYIYDKAEYTIQKYFEVPGDAAAETAERYAQLVKDYNSLIQDFKIRLYVLIGIAVVAGLLLILLIVSVATRKKSAPVKNYQQEEPEEELKTYIPVSGGSGKSLSKEERYMLGEEDEYLEYDELDMEESAQQQAEAEAAITLDHVEQALESQLAEDASGEAAYQDDDDDDFEIFDL